MFVLLVALAWCLCIAPGGAVSDPAEALSYGFVETPAGVGVHLLSVDLRRVELKLLQAKDLGKSVLTARQFAERSGAVAVFNGPFFDLDGSPMGLLIVDGIEQVPLRSVDWGVFALDAKGPSIVHTSDWKSRPEVRQAFQVGPRLVVDGAALSLKRQIARRTALCVLADGRVKVLVAGNAIWADDLATFFVAEGCTSALNLDAELRPSSICGAPGPRWTNLVASPFPWPWACFWTRRRPALPGAVAACHRVLVFDRPAPTR